MLEIYSIYVIIIFLISEESKIISRGNIEYGCEHINKKNVERVSKYLNKCLDFHVGSRLTCWPPNGDSLLRNRVLGSIVLKCIFYVDQPHVKESCCSHVHILILLSSSYISTSIRECHPRKREERAIYIR